MREFKFFRGFTTDVIIGRRGETYIEPGLIYAPYLPMSLTLEPIEISDYTLERFRRMVNNSFFGASNRR
jgi:hypothetical protein